MKKRFLIAATATTLLLSGCTPSLNPFFTDKNLVFDSGLAGQWRKKKEGAADDQDLQRFVLKHLGENELFREPNVFVRK